MKNQKTFPAKLKFFGMISSILFTMISCEEDNSGGSDEPLSPVIELSAENIGPGGETLTMDASASTGTSDLTTYVWTIHGQSGTISHQGTETSLSTSNAEVEISTSETELQFTSESTGQFSVSLRLEDNGSFAEGNSANFTVAGSIHLSEVPDGYEFKEINFDQNIPDYIFDGDVNISNASIDPELTANSYLVFQVPEGAQVTINGELSLRNARLTITSASGTWKGMIIDSDGNISGNGGTSYVTLINAGGEAIGDYEPSALVMDAATVPSIYLETENCQGYDVSFGSSVAGFENGSSNQLLYYTGDGNGIYAPIHLWGYLGLTQNTLSLEADIDVQQTIGESNIPIQGNVYIKGNGATISNYITFNNGSGTIYVEEDAALIFGDGVRILSGADIRAVDDAPWRGIYIGSNNNSSVIINTTITNAGSDIITNGAITATDKAAVYVQGRGLNGFMSNTISGSGGYGVFNSADMVPNTGKNNYRQNTFENTAGAAVRLPQEYGAMFSGNDNTFTMNEEVAAVEVFQTAGGTVYHNWTWESLEGSNFYHFTGNLNVSSGNMEIGEGANFRFNTGKGFLFSSNAALEITGTSENPVVFEAAGASWGGLFVGGSGITQSSRFIADYLTIDGGGDVLFLGATEMANLVVNTNLGTPPPETYFSITNCTFSNSSAGWGVVLDSDNSFSLDLEDASLGNTFEGNQLGAFNDKTL